MRNRIVDENFRSSDHLTAKQRAQQLKKQYPDDEVTFGFDYQQGFYFVRVYEDDRTGEDVQYDRKTGKYL